MTKPSKARPSKGKSSKGPWIGGALLALSALGAAALLAAPMLAPRAPTDPETGCRTDRPPPLHIAMLIDASEPFAARHKRLIFAQAEAAQRALPQYGRLSMILVNADDPQEPTWLASLCSPGNGDDANPLFANPDKLRARWRAAFAEPIDNAARRASANHEDASSPIAASITALARDPRFTEAATRSLVLVSDLMENRPGDVSLYDAAARFDVARDQAAPLRDVAVTVVMLDRPRHAALQTSAWDRFWQPWFDASDATVTRLP